MFSYALIDEKERGSEQFTEYFVTLEILLLALWRRLTVGRTDVISNNCSHTWLFFLK